MMMGPMLQGMMMGMDNSNLNDMMGQVLTAMAVDTGKFSIDTILSTARLDIGKRFKKTNINQTVPNVSNYVP